MLTSWSNTRLDEQREWQVDAVVNLFLASSYYKPGGDLLAGLQLWMTDQAGPIQGVCERDALAELAAEVHRRTGERAAREETS
jgi:hypothetical protein